MKKSVIILIALIYVLSIALVSFFGLKAKDFHEIVYTNGIELLNENIKIDKETGEPYDVVYPDANGEWKYQLKYRVHPDNATDNSVTFSMDEQAKSYATIDENGIVTLTRANRSVTITIQANDGSGAKASITLTSRRAK